MSLESSKAILSTLHDAGVTHAFGLPGHQNIDLFEALRTSSMQTVVPTNELSASFMANGYNRASGKVALLATIPGPGFTYALTGLAEAWLDSAALVHLTSAPRSEPGKEYQLQALEQAAMAAPVVKAIIEMGPDAGFSALTHRAVELARGQEPGPVLIQTGARVTVEPPRDLTEARPPDVEQIAEYLSRSRRTVMLVGQGAAGAAQAVAELTERVGAAVVSTTSGRGVLPEDHRQSLGFEMSGPYADPLNDLIATSDLVLAIGCKFSHNGSRGFRLAIPREKLIHIDASAAVVGANYPVRIGTVGRSEDVIPALVEQVDASDGWTDAELGHWRKRGLAESWPAEPELVFSGGLSPRELMAALRDVLPREAIVVTDSGRHQMLVRRWYRVMAARGLIVPTNLQSMGFAIPAAIGAALARPDRPVVAVLGDGSLMISGLELATAARLGIRLTVIVVNDGAFGVVRTDQLYEYGNAFGTDTTPVDIHKFAVASGIDYRRLDGSDPRATIAAATASPGVTLVEVPAREARSIRAVAAKTRVKRFLLRR